MTLFLISGIVGFLGARFNKYLVQEFATEHADRVSGKGQSKPAEVPLGIGTDVFRSWTERIADSAANLPPTVLTAVAYSDLALSTHTKSARPLFVAIIIVVVVIVAIVAVVTSKPKKPPLRFVASMSLWSWGLLVTNLVGLCLAFANR